MERLAGAILLQAVKDWQDERRRAEVRVFLHSDAFRFWVEILDLDPVAIRGKLEAGQFSQFEIRAAYR